MNLVLILFYAVLTLTILRLLVKITLAISYNLTRRRTLIDSAVTGKP